MKYLTTAVSIVAVLLFGLSYLQKKRQNIVLVGTVSRVLYVVQYVLAGAFAGAALDVLGALGSALAGQRDKPFVAKHIRLILATIGTLMLAAGITLTVAQKKPLELLPMAGVMLQTGALWLRREKDIRRLSLAGTPFWLIYNLCQIPSGSMVFLGDIWCATSLLIASFRYDWKKPQKRKIRK